MSFKGHSRILEYVEPFIHQLKPPQYIASYAECFVVFIHYRWSAVLVTLMLAGSLSGWFAQENAICINKFDRSEISPEMQDICITYPYTIQRDGKGQEYRAYALHYKWIPYTFALILTFFIGLQLLITKIEDPKVRNFLSSISKLKNEEERYQVCSRYFVDHVGRHAHLPTTRTYVLLSCLSINLVVFFVVDLTLAGFYLHLPLNLFAIREIENLSDAISVAFPPFVECELAPKMQLWMDRTERIGCYLPLMELYEKMFVGLWLWQACIFLLILLCLANHQLPQLVPRLKRDLLTLPNRPQLAARLLSSSMSLGDLLLLLKVKPLLTTADFQNLLECVSEAVRGVLYDHGD